MPASSANANKPVSAKALYFIGLVAPPEIEEPVLGWKLWMRDHFGCKVALKSPAHITLIPPFYLDVSREQEVIKFLDEFVRHHQAMDLTLNGFGSFSRRVIYVHVEPEPALDKLFHEITKRFNQELPGLLEPEKRKFQAHVTIANRDIPPHAFHEAMQHFGQITYTAKMHSANICLLKLEPGKWNIIKRSILR